MPQIGSRAVVAPGVVLPPQARLKGRAEIRTLADVLVLGPSRTDGVTYCTAHRDLDIGVRVIRGCFSGTLDEFIQIIGVYTIGKEVMNTQAWEYVAAIRAQFNLPEA
ncbi:MAG: hypothetical protein ABI605_10845 [Rhizobacter sp.]